MNDAIDFLIGLQDRLNNQETDMQASPRFWSVMDYRWVPGNEDSFDRVSFYCEDSAITMSVEEYVENVLSNVDSEDYSDNEIDELRNIMSTTADYYDILDWAKKYDWETIGLVYESKQNMIVPNTLFLTKEECRDHIRANAHHYTHEAHTYAMTAWRSPEVEKLMNVLQTTPWETMEYYDSCKNNEKGVQNL